MAVEICAAGGHHLSLLGPPGAGKTMLAERLPTILPKLGTAAAIEVTSIHSVAGALVPGTGLVEVPPFCAPHHTASKAAIVGGGSSVIRPGAVSLAHMGILFLDEAPEFCRDSLDALRQPLESGEVTITRAAVQATFPARFTLVLAANVTLLSLYTFSCHSFRHLIGGRLDGFSRVPLGKLRARLWSGVSVLNKHHMLWAWASLFSVGFADFYVWLVALGTITDIRII